MRETWQEPPGSAAAGVSCHIVLDTKRGPRFISVCCKIVVSLAQEAVHVAVADNEDPVFCEKHYIDIRDIEFYGGFLSSPPFQLLKKSCKSTSTIPLYVVCTLKKDNTIRFVDVAKTLFANKDGHTMPSDRSTTTSELEQRRCIRIPAHNTMHTVRRSP